MKHLLQIFTSTLAASLLTISAAAETAKCQVFEFEKKESISIQDVGRLAEQKVNSGGAGTITYWLFDEEDRPVRSNKHAVAFIMMRTGDLGETPVGGFLWTNGSADLATAAIESPNKEKTVSLTITGREKSPGCKAASFTITLQTNGEVYANGLRVGTVH